MTPQALKASILQLAIQGKLVPQRPEEGNAEELYQQIQAEKQRLIAEGTIKREKALEPIKADEIPFDIPETWKWVRLGDCGTFTRGSGIKKNEVVAAGKPCVRYGQLYTTYKTRFSQAVSHVPQELFDKCKQAAKGDILMALTGENKVDIAMAVLYEGEDALAIGGDMTKFSPVRIDPLYLVYTLNSPYGISSKTERSTGDIIVHTSNDKLSTIRIPLPPLEEQKRIVAKIEEMLPLIDRYGEAYTELELFNKRFPDDLRKSILQEAIQGKLVPQLPEEGTAEELYQQIQAEKQRLIAAGTIKKEKPLPLIEEKGLPFDIPETWKWVRLGEIFTLQAGKFIAASEIQEKNNTTPYPCYGGNGCRGYVQSYNRDGDYPLIGRQGALCGNINRAQGKFYATEHAVAVEVYANTDVAWACLFLQALNLNQYATATAQPGLAVSKINEVLIPLPPLAEQQRIVAQIEELLALCKSMQ